MTTRRDIAAWLAGFDAAHGAESESLRARPLDSTASAALALSLIEVMWNANGGRLPVDPLRERDVAAVRETWRRLRAGWPT